MKQNIILASVSPRRKGLLQQIGLEFDVMPSNYEENMNVNIPPAKLSETLAYGKANDIAKRVKEGIVIGIDTFMAVGKKRIGKPKNKEDAIKTLSLLSGKTIKVYSGVAIIDAKTKKMIIDHEMTRIKMKKLSKKEIKAYVNTKEPLDKAGSIAIQGLGAIFIKGVNGCYSNVIGLPLACLYKNLKKFGVNIFEYERWKNYIE